MPGTPQSGVAAAFRNGHRNLKILEHPIGRKCEITDLDGRANLLEADAIAARIYADDHRNAVIAAGREVLRRTRAYLTEGKDFAVDTTLSGTWTTKAIKQARTQRSFVRLVYICLDSPEQNIQRIRERVAQSGHTVPDDDVRPPLREKSFQS